MGEMVAITERCAALPVSQTSWDDPIGDADHDAFRFMGKDNVPFHSVVL